MAKDLGGYDLCRKVTAISEQISDCLEQIAMLSVTRVDDGCLVAMESALENLRAAKKRLRNPPVPQ